MSVMGTSLNQAGGVKHVGVAVTCYSKSYISFTKFTRHVPPLLIPSHLDSTTYSETAQIWMTVMGTSLNQAGAVNTCRCGSNML